MKKTTKMMAKARLIKFAKEAKKAEKFINCRLMTMEHLVDVPVPVGFKIISIDGKPFIGKA